LSGLVEHRESATAVGFDLGDPGGHDSGVGAGFQG